MKCVFAAKLFAQLMPPFMLSPAFLPKGDNSYRTQWLSEDSVMMQALHVRLRKGSTSASYLLPRLQSCNACFMPRLEGLMQNHSKDRASNCDVATPLARGVSVAAAKGGKNKLQVAIFIMQFTLQCMLPLQHASCQQQRHSVPVWT